MRGSRPRNAEAVLASLGDLDARHQLTPDDIAERTPDDIG
jgi:hypothetical protein